MDFHAVQNQMHLQLLRYVLFEATRLSVNAVKSMLLPKSGEPTSVILGISVGNAC